MKEAKLNPTLFDKLTLSERVTAVLDEGRSELTDAQSRATAGARIDLDRYTESALRTTVRRELSWLLNTVHLGAGVDLSRYPHVQTSVLNYGLPDLTGRVSTAKAVQGRARDIEEAIRTYEPRMDPEKTRVEAEPGVGLDNAVAYVIYGDITGAVKGLPVKFFANVEVETGEAVVRE